MEYKTMIISKIFSQNKVNGIGENQWSFVICKSQKCVIGHHSWSWFAFEGVIAGVWKGAQDVGVEEKARLFKSLLLLYFLSFPWDMLSDFRGGREGERGGQKHQSVAFHMRPYWGPNPPPRHVHWLGIKPVTLGSWDNSQWTELHWPRLLSLLKAHILDSVLILFPCFEKEISK